MYYYSLNCMNGVSRCLKWNCQLRNKKDEQSILNKNKDADDQQFDMKQIAKFKNIERYGGRDEDVTNAWSLVWYDGISFQRIRCFLNILVMCL